MVFSFASLTKEDEAVHSTAYKKFTALFPLSVCALLLILFIFSGYYVAAESMHECHEEECPVCAVLQVCEAVLNTIGSALPIPLLASTIYIIYALAEKLSASVIPERSLVEEKIRMND